MNDPATAISLSPATAGVRRVISTSTPPSEARPPRRGERFAPDRHPRREMLFVLGGRSRFLYRDLVWALSPGTLVAIDSWEVHTLGYSECDDGLLHLWLHQFPSTIAASCLRVSRGTQQCAERFPPLSGRAFAFLSRRWDDAATGDFDPAFRRALFVNLAETAMREFALRKALAEEPEGNRPGDVAVFVRDYVDRMHGRDCSLERLEKVTGYSRFYLSRLFRRHCGMTIGAAVDRARLQFFEETAERGLKQRAVAEMLGFSSPSAFCTWKRRNSV